MMLVVGPASTFPKNRLAGGNFLYLDLPSTLPGRDAKPRVSLMSCKSCLHPRDHRTMPWHLLVSVTSHVFMASASSYSSHHVTPKGVNAPQKTLP